MTAALVFDRVSKQVGQRALLDSVDLTVDFGEVVGLLGPNGAGKSTLIRVATAQTVASAGTVTILGSKLDRSGVLPEGVGLLPERPGFVEHLSASENLRMLGKLAGIEVSVEPVLKRVGLDPLSARPVRRYSLGMRQRLALAQALLCAPRLAILDEPGTGLDALGIIELRRIVEDLAHSGVGILMASHLLGEVERSCDRVVLLKEGAVVDELDLRTMATSQVRVGCKSEEDWQKIQALMPLDGLVRSGLFGVFDADRPVDELVRVAVDGGVDINHISLEPIDLESVVIRIAHDS